MLPQFMLRLRRAVLWWWCEKGARLAPDSHGLVKGKERSRVVALQRLIRTRARRRPSVDGTYMLRPVALQNTFWLATRRLGLRLRDGELCDVNAARRVEPRPPFAEGETAGVGDIVVTIRQNLKLLPGAKGCRTPVQPTSSLRRSIAHSASRWADLPRPLSSVRG